MPSTFGAMRGERIGDRPRHRGDRRLMQHEVDAVHCLSREREVREIALEELDAAEMIEIAALAGDERVGDADAMSPLHELFRQMRPDEARAAGHQKMSHVLLSRDEGRIEERSAAGDRKPNSVRLRPLTPAFALAGYGATTTSYGVTIIPLAPPSLAGSSSLPGGIGRAVPSRPVRVPTPPYLALLRAGFCLPPVLPRARCALTAPFHPYPPPLAGLRRGELHGQAHRPAADRPSASSRPRGPARRSAGGAKAGGIFSVPLSFRLP